jgi:hypothetical protein
MARDVLSGASRIARTDGVKRDLVSTPQSNAGWQVTLVASALLIGALTLGSVLLEVNAEPPPAFPSDTGDLAAVTDSSRPNWVDGILPFRSDLEAAHALRVALAALRSAAAMPASGASDALAPAQAEIAAVLAGSPYHPDLWLARALILQRRDRRDPLIADALKMSYVVAPADSRLMPVRLATATVDDALADADLRQLVRGDLRLMLIRHPDLRAAVVAAYQRASSRGKDFLEQATASIDPGFMPMLRGARRSPGG